MRRWNGPKHFIYLAIFVSELNNDFDSVLRRKTALFTGEPKAIWERLADIDGKADINLLGNPSDISGLDAEYLRKVREIGTEGEQLSEYKGLKLRAEMARQRKA